MAKIPGLFGFVQQSTKKPAVKPISLRPRAPTGKPEVSILSMRSSGPPRKQVAESYARRKDVAPTKRSIRLDAPAEVPPSRSRNIKVGGINPWTRLPENRVNHSYTATKKAIPQPLAKQAHSAFSNPRADLSTAELNRRAKEQSAKLKKSPADRDRLRRENEAAQKRELADERKAAKRRGLK